MRTYLVAWLSALILSCGLCAAADPKQIAELADRQFSQIKAVTVEATLATRDPTNGQRLQDSIDHAIDSLTKALDQVRAEPRGPENDEKIAMIERLLAGAEQAEIAAYLNRYSSRRARLFLDRPSDRSLTLLEWNGEEQMKRAQALGYKENDSNVPFESVTVLREGTQRSG